MFDSVTAHSYNLGLNRTQIILLACMPWMSCVGIDAEISIRHTAAQAICNTGIGHNAVHQVFIIFQESCRGGGGGGDGLDPGNQIDAALNGLGVWEVRPFVNAQCCYGCLCDLMHVLISRHGPCDCQTTKLIDIPIDNSKRHSHRRWENDSNTGNRLHS